MMTMTDNLILARVANNLAIGLFQKTALETVRENTATDKRDYSTTLEMMKLASGFTPAQRVALQAAGKLFLVRR